MSQRRWSSPIWLTLALLTACAPITEPEPQPPADPSDPTVKIENRSHLRVGVFNTVDGQAKQSGVVAADTQVQLHTRR